MTAPRPKQPVGEWVAAKEQLPLEHTEVIVYAPKEDVDIFTAQYWSKAWHRSSAKRYAPFDDYFGDPPFKVTHWTPLPEPPK